MEQERILNSIYYIKPQLIIKKRIDNKVVVITDDKEPDVLDPLSAKLLQKLSVENQLSKILKNKSFTDKDKINILDKMSLLIKKGYLVEERNIQTLNLEARWSLEEVFFELSKRCNLKCKHCYIPEDIQKNELTFTEWKSVVDMCKDMGVSLIKLTGGEAMLAPYFFDLLTYIREKGIRVRLYTNGSFLSVDKVKQLKQAGVTAVQISLDGASETTHDAFRGTKGNYKRIQEALPDLESIGIDVILSFTSSSFNEHEVDDFIKLAREYKYVKVVVSPYINYHQTFKEDSMLDVTAESIEKLKICFEKNKDIWSDKTRYYSTFSNKYIGYCGFGLYSAYIDSTGKVLLCPLMNQEEYVVGNIRKQDLDEIWNSSEVLKGYRRHTLADIEECNMCKHVSICRSGCRARAYFISGSLFKKDPVGCKMFK